MLRGLLGVLTATLLALVATDARAADEKNEPPRREQADVFKKLDANNDGKISKEELAKLSEMLDTDKDGTISKEEFQKLNSGGRPAGNLRRGGNLDPEQLKKIMERIGGRGGNIDPEQLKRIMERFGRGGQIDPEQLKKIMERFGKGGDPKKPDK